MVKLSCILSLVSKGERGVFGVDGDDYNTKGRDSNNINDKKVFLIKTNKL